MRAKKSLGQHFLLHKRIAQRMVAVANITEKDTVVEIGPGTGKLTDALLEKAGQVLALEADENMVHIIEEKYASAIRENRLTIRHQDIRLFNPSDITTPYVLVANIPYYLTGILFRKFLETTHRPTRIVLLIQREVAKRIARDKKESILSLSVKAFGKPKYEFMVPRGAFFPAPTVDSAVLSIRDIHNPFSTRKDEALFFSLLHAGFSHKRKKFVSNLSSLIGTKEAQNVLTDIDIAIDTRAEDIPIEKWLSMTQNLIKKKIRTAQD